MSPHNEALAETSGPRGSLFMPSGSRIDNTLAGK
jgi:hypothetical protein